MNIDSRLYKRTIKPVGTPLPPNAADVASTLVVEWHEDASMREVRATIGDVLLVVTDEGRWHLRRGAFRLADGAVNLPAHMALAWAKRAAVLALAQHIVGQREVKPVTFDWSTVRTSGLPPTFGAIPADVARTYCGEPSPWVPKVGDRVRCVRSPSHRTIALGAEGVVLSTTGRYIGVDLDVFPHTIFTPHEIEPIDAKPALPTRIEVDVTDGPRHVLLEKGQDVHVQFGKFGLTLSASRAGTYRCSGRPGCGVVDVAQID